MKDLSLETPDECGVMLLSETSLFPGCSMMLNIFEPRYKTMLQDSLESTWMIALGDLNEAALSSNAGLDYGVLSLISFCKNLPDGRSNLVIKGLLPVQFTHWDKTSPYPKAKISPLRRKPIDSELEQQAIRSLISSSIASHLSHLSGNISQTILSDLAAINEITTLIDQVAHNFISEPALRLSLLSELDDRQRVHTLITALEQSSED